ncbi:peptide ABC transporter substrate-binding protein [Alteraurantiacibacter aestuarii]|uniref:Peptide ABC transporter substrate-binding protein n=1 Tax=Alteraurantiacibacter aestuarii TaxID=650004 RepID=A0A844ZMU3_9SPHN|nr:peptide ABC transporter substrate-binding protein [Alteraurantiacibacter aestuarii]MXO88854.1 peptide ABC transporter substrate-binding protein [Alteraurantiacibacter aestuarii]
MIAAFRTFANLATIFAAALALAACGSGERETDRAAAEGIILIGNGGEPQTLDPHLATGNPEAHILNEMFEGLTVANPDDPATPAPGVAESWEHDGSFTSWTFHLRDNATWTNGDPVVAGDFLYAWQRVLSPELGAQDSSAFYFIRNAEPFNLGQISDFSQVGVRAPDDRTLVVDLIRPVPTFPFLTSAPIMSPLSQRAVEAHGTMTDRQNPWATLENFVTNGPFMMKAWTVNQMIELEKNPDYWDAANVRLNGARFFPVDNVGTEENLFQDGRLHVTGTIPPDKIPGYRDRQAPELVSDPMLAPYFYYVNVERPPLDNVLVRRALSLAIDRQMLVDRVVQGGQLPAGGYMPPGYPDYQAAPPIAVHVEEARRLLAEAGYPGGEGFPRFEILINTSEAHRKIAEALQEMWRTNLGIDVGIYNQEWRVYLDALLGSDFALARASLVMTDPDIYSPLEAFTTDGSRNMGKWKNPRFNQLMDQAEGETDIPRRNALLQQAEQVMIEDLPIIPIYWGRQNYLLDPQVRGWVPNIYSRHPLKHVYFEN